MEKIDVIITTCNILKQNKIKYNLKDDFFELYLGDLPCYIQYEKLEEDLDYTFAQIFIRDENNEEIIYQEDLYNYDLVLTKDLIEDAILNIKNQFQSINRSVNEISKLLDKINVIKEDNNLSYNTVLNLFNEKIED